MFRMGLDELEEDDDDENNLEITKDKSIDDKELRTLESLYHRFCERMKRRNQKEAIPEYDRLAQAKAVKKSSQII